MSSISSLLDNFIRENMVISKILYIVLKAWEETGVFQFSTNFLDFFSTGEKNLLEKFIYQMHFSNKYLDKFICNQKNSRKN